MSSNNDETLPPRPPDARDPVEAVLEQFLARAGEDSEASIERFAMRLESAADRLRLRQAHELLGAALPSSLAHEELLGERYRIVRELGRGGFGIVYEAHDEQLDRRVALKVIRAAGPAELVQLEQSLIEESRSLARIASPDIVTVHDVVREDERLFLVLELVAGADLGSTLKRVREAVKDGGGGARAAAWSAALGAESEPVDWYELTAQVMLRLARGLHEAHEAGVLHRDMKPGNVLLGPGGAPKLVDFGLAYRAGSANASEDMLAGTPEYMAPEQVTSGRSGASRSTDIYGLGLVAYEMLALERAFRRKRDESLPELFQRIGAGQRAPMLERDPRIPAALAAIVEHALAVDPASRYDSMAQVVSDLERYQSGRPPKYASLGASERLAMNARRLARSPRTWAAAFLVAALGAWTIVALTKHAPLIVQGAQVFRGGQGEVVPIPDGEVLVGDEDLGVRVAGGRSGVLYTLSVFKREEGGVEYLAPTRPLLLERYEETSAGWGLRLPAGDHDVVVAVVSPDNKQEGIEVYVCDEERALFEDWLSALDEIVREEAVVGGVERARADALLDRLVGELRGGSPSARDLAQRKAAYEEIRRSQQEAGGGVRLFSRSYEVAP